MNKHLFYFVATRNHDGSVPNLDSALYSMFFIGRTEALRLIDKEISARGGAVDLEIFEAVAHIPTDQ